MAALPLGERQSPGNRHGEESRDALRCLSPIHGRVVCPDVPVVVVSSQGEQRQLNFAQLPEPFGPAALAEEQS